MHSQLYGRDSFNRYKDHDVKAQQQHKYNKDDLLSEEQTRKLYHGCNAILNTLNVEVCTLTLANTIIDSLSRALSTNKQPNPAEKVANTVTHGFTFCCKACGSNSTLSFSLGKRRETDLQDPKLLHHMH